MIAHRLSNRPNKVSLVTNTNIQHTHLNTPFSTWKQDYTPEADLVSAQISIRPDLTRQDKTRRPV